MDRPFAAHKPDNHRMSKDMNHPEEDVLTHQKPHQPTPEKKA
ncbi:MAG: hypothetical protein ACD_51C00146G0004 [uncultured bacterium]|nr:MAG: hypothetical protein ACD_51C00146G0004 [uncultured bacterium]